MGGNWVSQGRQRQREGKLHLLPFQVALEETFTRMTSSNWKAISVATGLRPISRLPVSHRQSLGLSKRKVSLTPQLDPQESPPPPPPSHAETSFTCPRGGGEEQEQEEEKPE